MKFSKLRWLTIVAAGAMFANPSGGTVTYPDSESATISSSGDTLTVDVPTADRVIIEWDDFSIASNETTEFDLPTGTAAILNRVTGENMSELAGSLTSNGQVFVINENGIVVTSSATISTGTFLASTLNVSDEDFAVGDAMTFTGAADYNILMENHGAITATASDGAAILLGFQVIDSGPNSMNPSTITAATGTVALGAGVEIVVQLSDEQKFSIVPHSSMTQLGYGIDHQPYGEISAVRAQLKADGNFYGIAINIDGDIATDDTVSSGSGVRISSQDGVVAFSGTISSINTTSGMGGEVVVLGEDITADGTLDVSAGGDGGVIYLGGGGSFFSADNVNLSSNGVLDASSMTSGSGGMVVVNASTLLQGDGTIEANADGSGTGGTIALTSGSGTNAFSGIINATGSSMGGTVTVTGSTCTANPTVDVSPDGFSTVCP